VQSRIDHSDLMRYLDGELTPEERERIEEQMERSTELQRELAVYQAMKSDLQNLTFAPVPVGTSVWSQVNRRLARPLGWVFLTVGVVAWTGYAAYLFVTSSAAVVEKLATSAVGIGIILLLATVIFERYQESLTDPYRDVHR
jgi:anti-sigma factor RsiW